MTLITPTEHTKAEWSRLAQAAYAAGRCRIGHAFSAAAAFPAGAAISIGRYDFLMLGYRGWLIGGWSEFDAQTHDEYAA